MQYNSPLPSTIPIPPVILLRVECHDNRPRLNNSTFSEFNIVARGPTVPITRQTFDDCLSWKKAPTPFIPFTSKWEKAMRKRQTLIEDGKERVVIVAIWAKDLRNVYDAYDVARWLDYKENSPDSRRQPTAHLDEYLVLGGIQADEYRVLAIFDGCREKNVPLRVPGLQGLASIPDAFLTNTPGESTVQKLEYEIYANTGITGSSEQLLYLAVFIMGVFGN
ncbi:hypothetical protein DM02DRAFT_693216 [Periconia macrospinosa]|uniref:DUF7587 domain-containing protein n=1 Tax=Periconia macrospinosa TaxID=97972 RepID=A0A2V1E0V4_9PLEO|nr:hypothetical protein DM02DRAFT_693216 [Periconia macrospinosa]